MFPDIDKVTGLIRDVAESEILPRFNRLAADERWEKRPGSWVTIADTAAEARLIDGLTALLPGSQVVGEEGVDEDPSILGRLENDGPVWLIDPVDGTSNFAAGKPRFAVMVALIQDGATRAGWIHEPLGNKTAIAVAGEGAFVGSDRLFIAAAQAHREMTVSLGGRLRRDSSLAGNFADVTNTACCGTDYMALALGGIQAAHYRSLKPWDHAPGELIFREAGGYAAGLDGSEFKAGVQPDGGLLLAADEDRWDSLAPLIRDAIAALR